MSPTSVDEEQEEAVHSAAERSDHEECRGSVQRISQSRHFNKAPLLTSFLEHICERSLTTPGDRITEYEIGVQVFRRSRSFDPRQDNIVRTYARQLRKRLDEYYVSDGAAETLRILLPRGGYTPVFKWEEVKDNSLLSDPSEQEHVRVDEEVEASAQRERRLRMGPPRLLWSTFICLLLISVAAWHALGPKQQPHATSPISPLHALWSQLFSDKRDTLVIPGDVGFVILQQVNHRTFTLAEYLGWQAANHGRDNLTLSYLKDQSYTSMLNLDVVSQLQRLPEVSSQRFGTRATRALRLEDLESSNVILLGSNFSNPWTELFDSQLNFHFVNHPEIDRNWIRNSAPAPGERAIYEDTVRGYRHPTYGVIAFLPDFSKRGHVLLIQGLDAGGTQAAVNLLFGDTDAMSALLAAAISTDGSIKSFEVLVEATSLGYDSRVVDCHILAERIHK